MKIKTELLQNMLVKAIKGSSNNRMIPITSLIGIEAKNDILTLITTDGSNQLRIKQKIELNQEIMVSDEFYTIVNADIFSKLVAKTTKEFIELNNFENYLEIKGNGNYKLEIALNEEGKIIDFPSIDYIQEEPIKLSIDKLKNALLITKVSIAKTMEVPFITGYYIKNDIYTTDRQLITKVEDKFIENPMLLSSEVAELLQLLEGEEVLLYRNENRLLFKTDTLEIYGKELEGKEQYPIQAIENCINLQFENNIKVDKNELLNILDRMLLFVTEYDKNGVFLDFVEGNKLIITSRKSNASEEITVEGTIKSFNCLIDINMLKEELQTIKGEKVELWYGQNFSIKLVEDNTTIIISLLNKDD